MLSLAQPPDLWAAFLCIGPKAVHDNCCYQAWVLKKEQSSNFGEFQCRNLRANFFAEIPAKEFFNSHRPYHSLTLIGVCA